MKINPIIIATACTLSAAFGIASIQHRRVHADGNRAGGSGERSGAEGRLGAAGDGGPLMMGTDGGEDFGLFNQDGGAHGSATLGLGQFDGQAIHSDGGRGNVAFGSVRTKGDAGSEVVASIGTNVQTAGLPGEGRDGEAGGAGADGFHGGISNNVGVMDEIMPPRVEGSEAVGRTGDRAVDASVNVGLDIQPLVDPSTEATAMPDASDDSSSKGGGDGLDEGLMEDYPRELDSTEATGFDGRTSEANLGMHNNVSLGKGGANGADFASALADSARVISRDDGGILTAIFAGTKTKDNHITTDSEQWLPAEIVHVVNRDVRSPATHGSLKMKEETDVSGGLLDAELQVALARHDQHRALDFPDMDDSSPRVVLRIKKNRSLTASALPAPFSVQGQHYISPTHAHGRQLQTTWSQRGSSIYGEAADDLSGMSVSMSGDGLVLAVGAYYNDGNGDKSGSVRVYDWDGSNHVQRGDDIDGDAAGDYFGEAKRRDEFGYSVAISGDGSVLAIGAPWNDDNGLNSGSAHVYTWS